MKNRIVVLLSLVVVLGPLLWLVTVPSSADESVPPHTFDIARAYIIALEPQGMGALASSIQHYLRIPHTHVLQAINGSMAPTHGLSLYTRYLMRSAGPLPLPVLRACVEKKSDSNKQAGTTTCSSPRPRCWAAC
jgi:hypothetical protein